ncbi:hypothetical protein ACFWUQ_31000 [Streptomyces sp. NPDC058662]
MHFRRGRLTADGVRPCAVPAGLADDPRHLAARGSTEVLRVPDAA